MVNKCAAINCRSGYAKEKKYSNNTFHTFSFNDEKLLNQYHPNPEKIDDFDVACSIGHKQIITEKIF